MNVTFLVGWAFNIAASANLPALVMLLFWKRTTKQGITAAVTIGMLSSLAWILASPQVYRDVYDMDATRSIACRLWSHSLHEATRLHRSALRRCRALREAAQSKHVPRPIEPIEMAR